MFNEFWRRTTTKIHGNERNGDGVLLTKRFYIWDDQEIALGQCYWGLLGAIPFIVIVQYAVSTYGHGGKAHFPSYSAMPLDMKILMPIAVIGHLIALASAFRLVVNWKLIQEQERSNIE